MHLFHAPLRGLIAAALASTPWIVVALRRRLSVVTVHGCSMAPVLVEGDRVLVLRRRPARLRRGDVVAARFPEHAADAWEDAERFGSDAAVPDWVVKRVVALPGERPPHGDALVPPGHLFLKGDSPVSMDSRHWGPIPVASVRGVVVRKLQPGGAVDPARSC